MADAVRRKSLRYFLEMPRGGTSHFMRHAIFTCDKTRGRASYGQVHCDVYEAAENTHLVASTVLVSGWSDNGWLSGGHAVRMAMEIGMSI